MTPLRTKISTKDGLYRLVDLVSRYRYVSLGLADIFQEDKAVRLGRVEAAALLVASHRPQDCLDVHGWDF